MWYSRLRISGSRSLAPELPYAADAAKKKKAKKLYRRSESNKVLWIKSKSMKVGRAESAVEMVSQQDVPIPRVEGSRQREQQVQKP